MAKAVVALGGIAGFVTGIFFAGLGYSLGVISGVAALLIISVFARRFRSGIFFAALGIFIGAFYYQAFFRVAAAKRILPENKREASGVIASEPRVTPSGTIFTLSLEAPFRGNISVFTSDGSLSYGDRITFTGVISPPKAERDLPAMSFPEILAAVPGHGNAFRGFLIRLKLGALLPARRLMPGENGAFLEGLLLGYQNDFTQKLKDDLRASGTTHLIALSGYNVGVIVWAIQKLLFGRVPRRINYFLTVALIGFFTLMVGAEASILRAAIMGSLLLTAKEIGRFASLSNALLWTAFGMLLFDPGALFTPGFLLSFLSLGGIVYLAPAILALLHAPKEGARREFMEQFALTLSAQLAVLPVLLLIFGNVSPVSLLANMMILPLMPLTMLCGFIFLGASLILPFAAPIAAKITALFLSFELGIIHSFAGFSNPVSVARVSPVFVVGFYAVLAAFAAYHIEHGKEES